MYKIEAKFIFHYAHRLMKKNSKEFYPKSKCGSLHGHEGVVLVEFKNNFLNEYGFVIDFSEIKTKIKQWIDNNWDHATIINYQDEKLKKFLYGEGDRYFIMPEEYTTSAESLAKYLYNIIKSSFDNVQLSKVTVHETSNNKATYYVEN